jgi:hypothetical protein
MLVPICDNISEYNYTKLNRIKITSLLFIKISKNRGMEINLIKYNNYMPSVSVGGILRN